MNPTATATIRSLRNQLGRRVVIAAHYYVRPQIKQHGDLIGDSLELARLAAEDRTAESLVFCGVQFMAETAALVAGPGRNVYPARSDAGCPLADCATGDQAQEAFALLGPRADEFSPICYVNSSSEIKAFCGSRGGATCTSSSAATVFSKYRQRGQGIFFLPDQHLGANTARTLGIREEDTAIYDPVNRRFIGPAEPDDAEIILWKGECPVHQEFSPSDVVLARSEGRAQVAVHPECSPAVCRLADLVGSTAAMVRAVEESPPDLAWAVGTEAHLVHYLADMYPERTIASLGRDRWCEDMRSITETDLAEALDHAARGHTDRAVHIDPSVGHDARKALERMLSIVSGEAMPG